MERKEPYIKLDNEKIESEDIKLNSKSNDSRFSDLDRALRAQEYRMEKKAENALLTFLKFELWKAVILGLISVAFMWWIFSSTPKPKDFIKMLPLVKTQPQKIEKKEDKKISCISREEDGC